LQHNQVKNKKTVSKEVEKGLMQAPYVTVNPQLVKDVAPKSPYLISEK
jgi:hypothetical protein